MDKKTIMLCCAAGMSTSILVKKMQDAATSKVWTMKFSLAQPLKLMSNCRASKSTASCLDRKSATCWLISRRSWPAPTSRLR